MNKVDHCYSSREKMTPECDNLSSATNDTLHFNSSAFELHAILSLHLYLIRTGKLHSILHTHNLQSLVKLYDLSSLCWVVMQVVMTTDATELSVAYCRQFGIFKKQISLLNYKLNLAHIKS